MSEYLRTPGAREALKRIDEVMRMAGNNYYLIGAQALSLALEQAQIRPIRTTRDIDFAVETESAEAFKKLSVMLLDVGFSPVEKSLAFFLPEFQIQIDLIPFGKLEKERRIYLPGNQNELSVLGFLEVLNSPVKVNYSDFILSMPSLAGLAILKLLAWSDRPTHRSHDLGDVYKIILHYSDIHFQEILTNHSDLIPADSEPDWILIGAELLGRHAKNIACESNELISKLSSLLLLDTKEPIPVRVAQIWSGQFGGTLEYNLQIAYILAQGFSQ